MPTTNEELIRAIQRLIDQQAADRAEAEKADEEDRRRLEANERLLIKTRKEFLAYKEETTIRLDRKSRRIRWLGWGLALVSFLFFVMLIASLFQ